MLIVVFALLVSVRSNLSLLPLLAGVYTCDLVGQWSIRSGLSCEGWVTEVRDVAIGSKCRLCNINKPHYWSGTFCDAHHSATLLLDYKAFGLWSYKAIGL